MIKVLKKNECLQSLYRKQFAQIKIRPTIMFLNTHSHVVLKSSISFLSKQF